MPKFPVPAEVSLLAEGPKLSVRRDSPLDQECKGASALLSRQIRSTIRRPNCGHPLSAQEERQRLLRDLRDRTDLLGCLTNVDAENMPLEQEVDLRHCCAARGLAFQRHFVRILHDSGRSTFANAHLVSRG